MAEKGKKTSHTDKIMALVRRALEKDRGVGSRELYERAAKADASVKKLTLQQFHAKYPLQVKRQMARTKPRRRRKTITPRKRAEVDRAAIRKILLSFARAVSAAEGTAALIDVLANVDKYVDRILAASKARR